MKTNLNLVPEEIQRKSKKKTDINLIFPAVGVIVLFLLLNAVFISKINYYKNETDLRAEQALRIIKQYSLLEKELEVVEKIKADMNQKEESLKLTDQMLSFKKSVSDLFKEISIVIPEHVWLDRINFDGISHILLIEGKTFNNDFLQSFLFNLKNSNYFLKVELKKTELEESEPPIIKFIIETGI